MGALWQSGCYPTSSCCTTTNESVIIVADHQFDHVQLTVIDGDIARNQCVEIVMGSRRFLFNAMATLF